MEIKDGTYTISFKALDPGEVFRYRDCFYMVIVPFEAYNAVELESGELQGFSEDEVVKQVNVTLQIDN